MSTNSLAYYFQDPKTQSIPCWSEDDLERIFLARWSRNWYVSEQTYKDNDILKYNTIIISWVEDTRVEYVREYYGIEPAEAWLTEWVWYYKFIFDAITYRLYQDYWSTLADLYAWSYEFYRPHDATDYKLYEQPRDIITRIRHIWDWIADTQWRAIRDPKNDTNIDKANRLDPRQLVQELWYGDEYDEVLKIIIWYGSNYKCATGRQWINSAHRFFADKYNIEFASEEEAIDVVMSQWVIPASHVYQSWSSLGYDDADNKFKKLTDFIIYVHYKLLRWDQITYIVSIIGEHWQKHHIEWKNFTSDSQLSAYVQWLWPFHISNWQNYYKTLHQYISIASVPIVNVINKFWVNPYGKTKLITYADAVIDLETKKVYEEFDDSNVIFLDSIGWVRIESPGWELLSETMGEKTPYLWDTSKRTTFDEMHAIMKSMFVNNSADMLMFTLCTWMWSLLYNDDIDAPLFFVTWPSWSGKTTYAKILSSVFGIRKPLSLEGTTPFPLRMGLTFLDWLPLFMNEFRTRMSWAYEKTQIIKALFDGTPFERWRKDMTIDKSVFSAAWFIEWEELPESGATRTRLVMHCLSQKWQNKNAIPELIIRDNVEIFKRFQYSYIMGTNKEDYQKYLNEAWHTFRSRDKWSARIAKNMHMMYAAAMAFAPHRKEEFITVIKEILKFNEDDYARNNTGMEVIKIAWRYLQSKWAKYHIEWYSLILPWQEIAEYVQRSRTMTELAFDSYRPNLEWMGFEFWFFEVHEKDEYNPVGDVILIDWVKVYAKDIPDEWKCNKDIYNLFREYEKNKYKPA